MQTLKPLEEIVFERPDLRPEVEDFANFLLAHRAAKIRNGNAQSLSFNHLEGCLKHLTHSEQEIEELKKVWEPK